MNYEGLQERWIQNSHKGGGGGGSRGRSRVFVEGGFDPLNPPSRSDLEGGFDLCFKWFVARYSQSA